MDSEIIFYRRLLPGAGAGLLHMAWMFYQCMRTPRQIRLIHGFGREVPNVRRF